MANLIVLVGPSGSGKSTLATGLYAAIGGARPLTSYSTRLRRTSDEAHPGEIKFVSDAEFDAMKQHGEFMWTVKPNKRPYRYGTRGSDVMAALTKGVSIAILTGDAPALLYGYTLGTGQTDRLLCLYLYIDDYVELRRRLKSDVTRHDIESRLASASWENDNFIETPVPYYTIDATQSEQNVLQSALAILKNFLLP